MRFWALLFILLGCASGAFSQSKQHSYYKDLPKNGEVFFSAFAESFQQKFLEANDTAFAIADSAQRYYQNSGNLCALSNIYAIKGRLYNHIGRRDSATKYYLNAAKLVSSTCGAFQRYYLYNSWGMMQEAIGEYRFCDSLYSQALREAEKLDDKTYALNVRTNQCNLLSKQGKLLQAIALMRQIKELAWKYNIAYHKLSSLQNLGAYYIDAHKYDSALINLLALQGLVTDETSPALVMDMYNNLGVVYEKLGKLDEALEYYRKSIRLAKATNNSNKLLTYLNNYAYLQHDVGNHETAWAYITNFMSLKDSLFSLEKYGIIKKLETQYQTSLQREQLLSQKLDIERANRNRNIMIFALSALFIVLVAVYSRLRYTRKNKKIVEREKKRSDELLRNILPEEVAEELKQTGNSPARDFANVTVMFTDFKGFTELSAKLTATEVVEQINYYFKKFDEIIERYNIEKIKTIGDSYMAVGGLPIEDPRAAKNTVMAALAMLKVVNDHNEVNERMGQPLFQMRVGIHSGPVVAGIVGLKKFQYDIWGDTVNTASRMESASEVDRINISDATYELIKNDENFVFESRGHIETKGKGLLRMYFVQLKPKTA